MNLKLRILKIIKTYLYCFVRGFVDFRKFIEYLKWKMCIKKLSK